MKTVVLVCAVAISGVQIAHAGPKSAVSDAVDPICTTQKAVKGAAMKSTVGVGNRCGVAETARDVTGVDGKAQDAKDVNVKKSVKNATD